MEPIRVLNKNQALKIQIYTSEVNQTIELKNLDTQEKLMFINWKHVIKYLEAKTYQEQKGLR